MFRRLFAGAVAGVTMAGMTGASAPSAMCAGAGADGLDVAVGNGADEPDLCWVKTWGVPWIKDWDNPSRRGLPTQTSRVKRQIILIRHGQYVNEKSDVPDSERRLTPLGEEQARMTGRYLKDLFANAKKGELIENSVPAPRVFHVSDLTRAKQTSAIILEELGTFHGHGKLTPRVDPLLRERFPCDTEPPHKKKAREVDSIAVEEAFTKIFHRPARSGENSCEIVVGHANVIRYFICRSLQIPPEAWLRFSLPHCSITSIVVGGGGGVKVSSVGAATHLPAENLTFHNLA